MDVVLGDDEGPRLAVLAQTDAPEAWARRLHTAYAKASDQAAGSLETIRIAGIGTWSCPAQRDEVVQAALGLLTGRVSIV